MEFYNDKGVVMTKEETLNALQNAKKVHQQQMIKIENLLDGKDIKNPTAVNEHECDFGKWFYAHQESLTQIVGLQLFERIEQAHSLWHQEYIRIYKIFFLEKKGFFSKLFGKKIEPFELDKAKLYYKELEDVSKELLHAIDATLRRINALPESKFH
jgi:hypothetical protein